MILLPVPHSFSDSVPPPLTKGFLLSSEENDTNAFWDILQMATSIFCACGPMYKTLLPLQSVWSRLKISIRSWASRTRLYRSVPSHKTDSAESSQRQRSQHEYNGGSAGTATNGPVFIDGTETQYTWAEVEMVDIDFSNRPAAAAKNGHMQSNMEIV